MGYVGGKIPARIMTRNIISRKDARALGLKKYFTGIQCNHGHTDERYTRGAACVSCRSGRWKLAKPKPKEHKRELGRRYYERNRKRIRTKRNLELQKDKELRRKRYAAHSERGRRMRDLIAALREEMPEILERFGL